MKRRQGYKGYVIEARPCELEGGGLTKCSRFILHPLKWKSTLTCGQFASRQLVPSAISRRRLYFASRSDWRMDPDDSLSRNR